MKAKLMLLSGAVSLSMVMASHAEMGELNGDHHAGRKLARGVANVLFGVVELPNQVSTTISAHGGGAGATYGVGKGIGYWFKREIIGLYEIVTFPFPGPNGYRPLMHPEFPVEHYEP